MSIDNLFVFNVILFKREYKETKRSPFAKKAIAEPESKSEIEVKQMTLLLLKLLISSAMLH
jgi:hypothetical protein